MDVSINGIVYENAQWNGNTMTLETDMTLAQIEAAFTPGQNADIIVSEGDEEIGRYYNKGLSSVTVSGSNPRIVNVAFDVTQIDENAETSIRNDIEASDGAIVELAEIVGELSELDMPSMSAELQSHQETINTWFGVNTGYAAFMDELRREGGILDMFNARITALEHEVGIVSVVPNEETEGK